MPLKTGAVPIVELPTLKVTVPAMVPTVDEFSMQTVAVPAKHYRTRSCRDGNARRIGGRQSTCRFRRSREGGVPAIGGGDRVRTDTESVRGARRDAGERSRTVGNRGRAKRRSADRERHGP